MNKLCLIATTSIVLAVQSVALGQATSQVFRAKPEHMRAVIPLLEVQQLEDELDHRRRQALHTAG